MDSSRLVVLLSPLRYFVNKPRITSIVFSSTLPEPKWYTSIPSRAPAVKCNSFGAGYLSKGTSFVNLPSGPIAALMVSYTLISSMSASSSTRLGYPCLELYDCIEIIIQYISDG